MQTANPTLNTPPRCKHLEDLPEALLHRIIVNAPGDTAARLGCASRRWRALSSQHPLLAPLQARETPQGRIKAIVNANQPAALARFLVACDDVSRERALNMPDDSGATPLMYMASLRRPEGGGIHLASVLIGMGAANNTSETGYTAAKIAAVHGNQKLAFWLFQAESFEMPTSPFPLRDVATRALPFLVPRAHKPESPDFVDMMKAPVGYIGRYNAIRYHSDAQIIATWRALLDIYPGWRSGAITDAQAHTLFRYVLQFSAPLPLIQFLHGEGFLVRAARHADMVVTAIVRGIVQEDVLLYLMREIGASLGGLHYSADCLYGAIRKDCAQALEYMLDHGADITTLLGNGQSLLGLSLRERRADIYLLLESRGAQFSQADSPVPEAVKLLCRDMNDFEAIALEILATHPCSKKEAKAALKEVSQARLGEKKELVETLLKQKLKQGA